MLFWVNSGISQKLATYLFVLHLSIFCHMLRFSNQGHRGCRSLSQHSPDERRKTCWIVASPSFPHALVPAEQGSGSVSLRWTLLDCGRTAEYLETSQGLHTNWCFHFFFFCMCFAWRFLKTQAKQNRSLLQLWKAWANYSPLGFPI